MIVEFVHNFAEALGLGRSLCQDVFILFCFGNYFQAVMLAECYMVTINQSVATADCLMHT